MLYINNELLVLKDNPKIKKMFDEFRTLYQDNFNKDSNTLAKPIVVKYLDELTKPDPRNRGKFIRPKSIGLNLVARTTLEDLEVEVRYSRTAGVRQANNELKFMENSVDVRDGRLNITNHELAFFFHAFSQQNADNPKNQGGKNVFFRIENIEAERRKMVVQKAMEATFMARLWNEPADGGLGDKRLKAVAKDMMIPNVDARSTDELREVIDATIKARPELKSVFLQITDPKNATPEEKTERMQIVANAIENGKITQDMINRSFFLVGPDGVPEKKPLLTYEKKSRNPRVDLFLYLEAERPELLDQIKETMGLLTEV